MSDKIQIQIGSFDDFLKEEGILKEVSAQKAADILNVSRPYVVKLLESGKIPYHNKVGNNLYILFEDLMKYKTKQDAESETTLDELTAIAQEHNMGY